MGSMNTTTTPAADPTRNSLVDAIARKVELAAAESDPTAKARLEGSVRRMVAALDADDAKQSRRLDAAIRHWESLMPRLEGERRLIEDTLRDLRARRLALG